MHIFFRGQKIYVLTLAKLQDGTKQTGVLACLVNTPTIFWGYRRAANEPNQGSSMQQVVQNASNSGSTRQNDDSARKNITVTADAILVVMDVTIQIDQYKMQTDTKTITVKYTINFQYFKPTLMSRNRLSEFP